MTNNSVTNPNGDILLESWKEIANYLQRDVSTVMRWEKSEGLPVHRHHHLSRSSVYAYASELDAWRAQRTPAAEARPLWRQPLPSAALALVLLLALASVGSGPYIGTTVQAANAATAVTSMTSSPESPGHASEITRTGATSRRIATSDRPATTVLRNDRPCVACSPSVRRNTLGSHAF